MQLDLLDGLTTDQSGRDHHLASLSLSQGRKKEQMTSVISGRSGSISSGSADLQRYLESRLARRFATAGSTNSRLTWKPVSTPSGRSLSRLQVSAPCTSGTESGLWPTASARDHKGGYQGGRIRNGKWSVDTLDVAAQLTDWLTPTTSDTNGVRELDGKRSGGLNTQANTLWPTVTTQDNAQMAGQYSKTNGTTLGGAVRQCSAKTAKSGSYQLNPKFSLWLMGYPIEWASCAEQVTPLCRRSRQR